VEITTTDNHTWSQSVAYPDWVISSMPARPWPSMPRGGHLLVAAVAERFRAPGVRHPSVQLYIVIGSRHQFAFGNWKDYRQQTAFELEEDKKLGALLLPPELESAVYVFRRRVASTFKG